MFHELVRLQYDDKEGFVLEPCVLKQFVLERYAYSAHYLANSWLCQRLAFTAIRYAEFNEIHELVALADAADTQSVSREAEIISRTILANSQEDAISLEAGYATPPAGVTDVLGYYSDHPAWLKMHANQVALIFRDTTPKLEEALNLWLETWAAKEAPMAWPVANTLNNDIVVPWSVHDLERDRAKRQRNAKKRARALAARSRGW